MDDQAAVSDTLLPEGTQGNILEGATELGDGEYWLSEGVKGSGDMPEWYNAEKYKSVAEQAKAQRELEKRLGGFTGAPKDGYQAPEGVDAEDELFQQLQQFGEKTNMSQDALAEAWQLLSAQDSVAQEVSQEAELAKLGDNASQRISQADTVLRNNLSAEDYEKAKNLVTTAESVELIETMVRAMQPAKLPIDGNIQPGGITWADIEKQMYMKDESGNLLRSVDRNHEAKIQRMMKDFGGDKPYSQTFG